MPPRDPASSMVIPSSPARSRACRRDTDGSRSGTSTPRSRPRHAGSSATRHHGPPGPRTLIPRPAIKPVAMRVARAFDVAASCTPAVVDAFLLPRPRRGAPRRSAALRIGGRRRWPPAGCSIVVRRGRAPPPSGRDRRARPTRSPRASRLRGLRRRALPAGDRPPPQQPAARPRARRSSSVSGGRLQRPDSASAAAMRTAASSSSSSASAGLYGVGSLVRLGPGAEAGERIGQHPGGRVEVGQRYVRDLLLAGAHRAEQRRQRLPVLFAAEAADQADEVAAAENRQLGIERMPSGTPPRDATV